MHIGIWNNYENFAENRIFDPAAYSIGDEIGYPLILLKQSLNDRGIEIDTIDMFPPEDFDSIIFIDYPGSPRIDLAKLSGMKDLYLFLTEVEIVYPANADRNNHRYFKKVFTYRDDWVDNVKYFKFRLSVRVPEKLLPPDGRKEKFCTMIAGNKKNSDPRELYSERDKAIRWYESNHPEEFDLYGIGWDRRTFTRPLGRLNRFETLRRIFYRGYSSYRGRIPNKKNVLEKYYFSICYENARDIPGYITEKIFDCFFAQCVPVYLGAPNVLDFIPPGTFIDKRNFKTYEELYSYMKGMLPSEYEGYLSSIRDFVNSDKIRPFSAEAFIELIIKNLGIENERQ